MLAKALASASASAAKVYVEEVFSTYLYTGNNSTQTITNGIDLSGKGGLVWIKGRTDVGGTSAWGGNIDHALFDTARGMDRNSFSRVLSSNRTDAQVQLGTGGAGALSTGFDLGYNGYDDINFSGNTYASWTFRKAPKFFDVVTYTGNGTNRTIAHNLGSVPGCIIVKCTSISGNDWQVYHRSLTNAQYLSLNLTSATATSNALWNNTAPTSTVFSLGTDLGVNSNGRTYVAYLFAHDAGGFGNSGNDSVVKCGSFNDPGTGVTVDLGWEPQWVLLKRTSSTGGNWRIIDNMRGWPMYAQASRQLFPNTSGAEDASEAWGNPTPTGFFANAAATGDYIYIAIRRGPMKTPTDATKVFSARTSTNDNTYSTGFTVDAIWEFLRSGNSFNTVAIDRLRGTSTLYTSSTSAENAAYTFSWFDRSDGVNTIGFYGSGSVGLLNFRRAPGFFDVVAYKGTSNSLPQTISHNLGVKPEMMIVKRRDTTSAYGWHVWHSAYEVVSGLTSQYALLLNTTAAIAGDAGWWNQTSPTSTSFTVGDRANMLNGTFIAYLFASCPGVSKVGSYTGTGTTLNVDCGFTNGSRLVLIKRTDSTGSWYIWDSARGIVSGNDPYLLLNSTAAEVTNTDYIDPLSSGFQISSTAPAEINANGGSYIFLAVA